jgi:SNF family Na+-dependent transporter
MVHRESWRSTVGLVLAMAGNAVGLGNSPVVLRKDA